jgi:branched-chain amino acid transport system permease protein
MLFGWNTRSLSTPFDGKVAIGSLVEINADRVAIIIATLVLVAAVYLFFGRTRYGIAMQAASQNQLAAFYMGIPVKRLVSMTWAIGALIAAAAGALLAPMTQIDTTIGLLGIKALAGAVVGGFGSIPGALLGCILIGVIEPFADYYLPGIKGASAYVVMLVILFVRPEGLITQTYRKKV